MVTQCMCCHALMIDGAWRRYPGIGEIVHRVQLRRHGGEVHSVSHGACPECAAAMVAEYRRGQHMDRCLGVRP